MERAMDYEEKLESMVPQASRDVAAKITMPATDGVSDD
jgi:cytochrome c551/c552